jgi:hypothetical protein
MSEIPYVRELGDALERAAAAAPPKRAGLLRGRGRRRRRVAILAFAILLAAAAVTTAAIVSDPDRLAIGSVQCSESGDPDLGAAISALDGRSPVAVCAELWTDRGQVAPPLVACERDDGVFVMPGVGREACARAGLAELPTGYRRAEARVARLVRDVAAVEEAFDCLPPAELARRLQRVLREAGWTGWRAVVSDFGEGPCGWARRRGGDARLTLSPVLDPEARVLSVGAGPPRSLERRLYGERSILVGLFDDTGERCFGLAELREHVLRKMAATGQDIRFKLGRMPPNTGLERPRGDRYAEGCAIFVGAAPVYPATGGVAVEVELWQRPAGGD